MKTAVVAPSSPVIAFLVVLTIFISSCAGAQTPSASLLGGKEARTIIYELGYVTFAAGVGGIQATLSATDPAEALYFRTFWVLGGASTPGLNLASSESGLGFAALHGDTHLTEIVDYYWNTLIGFGYTGTTEALTSESVTYFFDDGERRYRAVLAAVGDDVTVSFTPVVTLTASK